VRARARWPSILSTVLFYVGKLELHSLDFTHSIECAVGCIDEIDFQASEQYMAQSSLTRTGYTACLRASSRAPPRFPSSVCGGPMASLSAGWLIIFGRNLHYHCRLPRHHSNMIKAAVPTSLVQPR